MVFYVLHYLYLLKRLSCVAFGIPHPLTTLLFSGQVFSSGSPFPGPCLHVDVHSIGPISLSFHTFLSATPIHCHSFHLP